MRLSEDPQKSAPTPTKAPIDYYRMFYGDTALSGVPGAMQCAYEMFTSERLLFGSDYPFGPDRGQRFIRSNLAAIDTLRLGDRDRKKVLVENARALLRIPA